MPDSAPFRVVRNRWWKSCEIDFDVATTLVTPAHAGGRAGELRSSGWRPRAVVVMDNPVLVAVPALRGEPPARPAGAARRWR